MGAREQLPATAVEDASWPKPTKRLALRLYLFACAARWLAVKPQKTA